MRRVLRRRPPAAVSVLPPTGASPPPPPAAPAVSMMGFVSGGRQEGTLDPAAVAAAPAIGITPALMPVENHLLPVMPAGSGITPVGATAAAGFSVRPSVESAIFDGATARCPGRL